MAEGENLTRSVSSYICGLDLPSVAQVKLSRVKEKFLEMIVTSHGNVTDHCDWTTFFFPLMYRLLVIYI